MDQIEEIENLVVQCLGTDYSEPQSVSKHNATVDKIRELVDNIKNEEMILQLLDNKNTSSWAAFQSLEAPEKCSKKVFNKSINVLKVILKKDVLESMAAEMLLKKLDIKS